MKLCTVRYRSEKRVGVVDDQGIALLDPGYGDMSDIIAEWKLREVEIRQDLPAIERVAVREVEWLAPLQRFHRDVLCTGWNYWDHFEEGRGTRGDQEVERPGAPTFFSKSPKAIIGPRDPIAFDPRLSQSWDYEGELAIVIGKPGRSIPSEKAWDHVFGFCLINDISQRDLQRRHGGQWLKGKSIDNTAPLGPYIVTLDEIDLENVRLQTFVNGEERQNAFIKQMAFPIPELISELSLGMTLNSGDLVITGTPSGVGHARKPPVFLKEGDEVVVTATGLGELRNTIVFQNLVEPQSHWDLEGTI